MQAEVSRGGGIPRGRYQTRAAGKVSDARRYPAEEVADAQRYPAEVSRGGGIPRGRYQTRGGIRRAELRERTGGGGGGTEDR